MPALILHASFERGSSRPHGGRKKRDNSRDSGRQEGGVQLASFAMDVEERPEEDFADAICAGLDACSAYADVGILLSRLSGTTTLQKELTPISSADEEPAAETVTVTAMERRREVIARVRFSRLVSIVRASATIQEDVAKEFDRLMRMVKQVEAMTDPHDPDYLASDELKTRTASVTLPMLCGRIASHVQAHLRSKSAQGCWVNSACFLLFRRLLEDEMDRPDLWAVGIDELLLPPLGPTAPGLGGSLVLHRAYGDATVALAITEAAHEDNDAEALASRREETQDTAVVRYCRKAGHVCSFVTSRVAAVVLWALRLIAPPMSLAEFHAACGRTLRRLNSWYWLLTSK